MVRWALTAGPLRFALPGATIHFGASSLPGAIPLEAPVRGQETFRRSVVSNTLSGRELGIVLPIRSAKRPVAGKRFLGRPHWPRPAWASSPSSAFCWRAG